MRVTPLQHGRLPGIRTPTLKYDACGNYCRKNAGASLINLQRLFAGISDIKLYHRLPGCDTDRLVHQPDQVPTSIAVEVSLSDWSKLHSPFARSVSSEEREIMNKKKKQNNIQQPGFAGRHRASY